MLMAAGRHGGLLGLVVPGDGTPGDETVAVNEAMRVSHPADVVVVNADVIVGEDWLSCLRAAAVGDSTVASATPLSIGHGGLQLSGFDRSKGLAMHEKRDVANWDRTNITDGTVPAVGELCRRSLRLHPRIATIGCGCVYIRRSAWELVGPLKPDLTLAPALDDFARSATTTGMLNVVADEVLVLDVADEGSRDEPSLDHDGNERSGDESAEATIAQDERGPLQRSLSWGRVALGGLSVTIDARALTQAVGGTQTYILGMVMALARSRREVRVLVAPNPSPLLLKAVADIPQVEILFYEDALRSPPLTDVVHRPQQIFTPEDITLLRLVGRRIVIGQQDLIAYHNPSYHPDVESWRAYRRTTRLGLAAVDQVVFFSEHARNDALAEDLVSPTRAHVVGIGWEPASASGFVAPDYPAGIDVGDRFLLCLGADYAHKNRPFAIKLLRALNELGWDGRLVLAGNHVPHGSSRDQEERLLRDDAAFAARVLDLGPVDDSTRAWLYTHACALLYPTIYEGFGLLPLEAARAGLPCLFAAQASLAELAASAATLTPWDAEASARAVLPLLDGGAARIEHLKKLRSLSVPTWEQVARDLVCVYEEALMAPYPAAAPRAWQELDRENHIINLDRDVTKLKGIADEYQDAYHRLERRVEFGLPLIDDDGLLSLKQQRGLMRVASRGRLGALALAPFGLLGRGGADKDPEV